MAINITFNDFDTVCFSNQHNIIQLINHAVHDALLLTTNLNQRLSSVERRVTAIEDLDATTHNTELYKEFEEIASQLRDLNRRVSNLE